MVTDIKNVFKKITDMMGNASGWDNLTEFHKT